MNLFDSHTHTLVSHDSKAPLADMANAAIAAGIRELHVTDHCDLVDDSGGLVTGFPWDKAKAQYHSVLPQVDGKLDLRLGLELGSATFAPDVARRILSDAGEELDFVLGSFHNWIGVHDNKDLYFSKFDSLALARQAVESCLDFTWTLVTDLADCYDSLAHIVYPLRYIRRDGQNLTLADYEEQVRAIFTQIARTDHALEVNTYQGRDLDSWPPLLRWFKQCGGRFVTLGSDAHTPSHMGKGIPEATQMLKDAGFDCVTTFVRRKPVEHKL